MALGTPTPTLIHQGPGWLYLNVAAPATGKRHLIYGSTTGMARSLRLYNYSLAALIVDTNGNIQQCSLAGESGASEPVWSTTLGATTTDGSAHWKLMAFGPDTAGTPIQPFWAASAAYTAGQMVLDSNSPANIWECTDAGESDSSAPTWGATPALGSTVTDGGVTWTCVALAPAYQFAGALEGVTEISMGAKLEPIGADQETLPIDVVMTGEAESIAVTLKESDAVKLGLVVPHSTYATGTDTGLPSGSQIFEEIAFGGLPPTGVPKYGVLFISKRKDQAAKFIVTQLYRAYQKDAVKLPIQRGKETTYKIEFDCLADMNRPEGDRGGKLYRQV